jgi:hypothetical protein
MAYVVRRPRDRWEIREAIATPKGPRARSLASFRSLDAAVLDRAERAAVTTFDRADVVAAARRAGAPIEAPVADRLARELLGELRAGRLPKPGLCTVLEDQLSRIGPAAAVNDPESVAQWIGASDEERGKALRELVELGDRLPSTRRRRLQFPRLTSAGRG